MLINGWHSWVDSNACAGIPKLVVLQHGSAGAGIEARFTPDDAEKLAKQLLDAAAEARK